MKVERHDIGVSGSRVLLADDFLANADRVVDLAEALAPFPEEMETAYPGLRRQISPGDSASAYVMALLRQAAPLLRSEFGAPAFSVMEASFSLVTTRPEALRPVQRVPHFDFDDPNVIAIIHHLHTIDDSGTAFYRHIATGLERADVSNSAALRAALRQDGLRLSEMETGFADDTNPFCESVFFAAARFNRLVMYQGCLLHSGRIGPDFTYDSAPRSGRLTANIFVRLNGGQP